MRIPINTVLFDLDGTLLDTAPDMAYALNQQRRIHHQSELPLEVIRPAVGYGSRTLLKLAFDMDDDHPDLPVYLEEFFDLYQTHLMRETRLFPEIEQVLDYLDHEHLPWGIVTNKPSRFALRLLNLLQLDQRTDCIVCGDSLPKRKPYPDPILLACEKLRQAPQHCVYIGDNSIDVLASKAAGSQSVVALYGYIHHNDNPLTWQADGYVKNPLEIISWLKTPDFVNG